MTKVLCQISGGYDSVAAAILLLEQGHEMDGMFFNLDQTYYYKELGAVDYVEDYLRRKYDKFGNIYKQMVHIELELAAPATFQPSEYIPIRNLVLATHSANFALARGYSTVAVGNKTLTVRPDDPYSFKDCSVEFYDKVTSLVNFCADGDAKIQFIMPLCPVNSKHKRVPLSKGQVIKTILDSRMDIGRLWTCYSNEDQQCGKCYHCVEAKAAFEKIKEDWKPYFKE